MQRDDRHEVEDAFRARRSVHVLDLGHGARRNSSRVGRCHAGPVAAANANTDSHPLPDPDAHADTSAVALPFSITLAEPVAVAFAFAESLAFTIPDAEVIGKLRLSATRTTELPLDLGTELLADLALGDRAFESELGANPMTAAWLRKVAPSAYGTATTSTSSIETAPTVS